MMMPTSIVCPVDFSPASLGGLHYALAIGRRFQIPVAVLTVVDPLIASIGDARVGEGWAYTKYERELGEFAATAGQDCDVSYEVRIGTAAPAILEAVRERPRALLVMSTHGMSGLRKWVLGATAERVLRGTTVPVLLAASDPGPRHFDELIGNVAPILAPVDFGVGTALQVDVAGRIAEAFHLPMMLGHVLEPLKPLPLAGIDEGELLSERYRRACQGLQSLTVTARLPQSVETLIVTGDPPEEIAHWIREKHVGLVIMSLHDAIGGGPRMGSVTYRTLVLGRTLTLALPPTSAGDHRWD